MLELSTSAEPSLQELFVKLCHNFNKSSNQNVGKIKSKLFEVLLQFSRPHNVNGRKRSGANLNEMDMLFTEIHCMMNMREYDRACELQQLLQKLTDDNGHLSDEILQCLKFLLCLSSWSSKAAHRSGQWLIPRFDLQFSGGETFAPNHLPVHGETRMYKASFSYTQYPREIFETLSDASFEVPDNLNHKLFEAPPGFDECGNPLYKYQGKGKDVQTKKTRGGSLGSISPTYSLNDCTLQLPVLTPYSAQNPMSFTLCSGQESVCAEEQNANDEGFIDAESVKIVHTMENTDIWETVSKIQRKPKQTWDKKHRLSTSLPTSLCLSQTGSLITQSANQGILRQLKLINPDVESQQEPGEMAQTTEDLIEDVINLLLGVPSKTFFYNKQKQQFKVKSKLSLPFLNSELLTQLLRDFLDCGSFYVKLDSFAQPQLLGTFLTNGMVLECFKEGVHQYLQYYRGRILYAKETQSHTLLSLHQAVYKAYRQLRFLTDFCLGERHLLLRVGQECVLPKGLKLLTYLYQSALQEWGGENDFLLLFLLKTACAPYFRFLHDWVFEGTLHDPYNEFNIRVNEKCVTNESCRSVYWSHGYVLKEKMSLVPFLSEEVTHNALLCGKSLNLLRICDPKHSLLDSCNHRPNLTLSLTSAELEKTFQESCDYYNRLNTVLLPIRVVEPCPAVRRKSRNSVFFKETPNLSLKTSTSMPESMSTKPSEPETPVADAPLVDIGHKTGSIMNLQNIAEKEEEAANRVSNHPDVIAKEAQMELQSKYDRLMNEADLAKEKLIWKTKRLELHEKRSELIQNELAFPEKLPLNGNPYDNVTADDKTSKHSYTTDAALDAENANVDNILDNLMFAKADLVTDSENANDVLDNASVLKEHLVVAVQTENFQVVDVKCVETVQEDAERQLEEVNNEDDDVFKDENEESIFDKSSETENNSEQKSALLVDLDSVLSVTVPKVKPYQTDYSKLGSFPHDDLLVTLNMFRPSLEWDKKQEVDCLSVPLPVFFHRSFNPPLQAQASLVNKAVLHHFHNNLHLMDHLNILRNLFFFNDGEFGRTLSRLIYNKASCLTKFLDLLNPFVLRSIANSALNSSLSGENPLVENLCLGPKLDSTTDPVPGFGVLMNLELKYKVEWPLDIVLSEECEVLYNHIFSFLLQINYVVWALTDVWFRLKHYDQLLHLSVHWQFRQIQVFRHEMLHFCQSLYEFVCRQVLQLSWHELLTDLQDKVEDLEQMRSAHLSYLQKACTRCMLETGRDFILQDSVDLAFQSCLSFHSQLIMFPWQQGLPFTEECYSRLTATYQDFKNHVKLLCRGIKFSSSGQKGAFVDLLLLLDTTNHYG